MAVRLAIGAEPRETIRLVLTGAGRLLGAGVLLGTGMNAATVRVLPSVLFGISPFDTPALALAALTLVVVWLVASAGPAIRAARIAPIDALRGD
jgi:putative ABC transport system permease protein